MKEKKLAATVRVPANLTKPIGHRTVELGLTFQAYVMKLIQADLARADQTQNPSAPSHEDVDAQKETSVKRAKVPNTVCDAAEFVIKLSPDEDPWAKKFLYIMRHGDAETVEAIMRNVDRFSLLARLVNREAAASDELDQLARQIAGDPQRRVEFLHQLGERYSADGKGAGVDEIAVQKKRTNHPRKPKTGS